jgi:hypothetical protein
VARLALSPDELITSTRAANELSRLLNQLADKRWFIQRNNKIEAVLLSIEEYQRFVDLEEEVEHLTLALTLAEREAQDDGYRISLDNLLAKYDLQG